MDAPWQRGGPGHGLGQLGRLLSGRSGYISGRLRQLSLTALTTGYVPTCEAPSHDISDTAALPLYPETARAATTPAGVKISRLTIEYHCTTWQGQRCVAIWGVRARAWPRRHEDSACLFLRPPEPIGTYQWRAFYQISGSHRKGRTGLLGGLKMREIK